MNCRQCSKVIPDGFIDCPWCGARGVTLAGSPFDSVKSSDPLVGTLLLSLASFACFAIIVLLNYFATVRVFGPWANYKYPQVSGYFMGRCFGSYILPALGVFLYYKIRRKSLEGAAQFLVISGWALLWTVVAFAGTSSRFSNPFGLPPLHRSARISSAPPPRTVAPTKWDPAIRSYYEDVRSFNEQYVSAVSKLDSTALPLYTPDSFATPERVQQALAQLQARLEVAKNFASPEQLLSRMPEYVQAIEAGDDEKKTFLDGFTPSARSDLAQRKSVSENEQSWLQASIGVYRFALSQQRGYSVQEGRVVFKRKSAGSDFDRKLLLAQLGRAEFIRSYGRYIGAQNRYMAQFGLPPLAIGGGPPPESSVSRFLSGSAPKSSEKTNP